MKIALHAWIAASAFVTGIFASTDVFAAGDVARGEAAYKKNCFLCHDVAAGKHKVGPSLYAIYGQRAGMAQGYQLYRGLRGATWTWDDQALDAYLADPPAYTKGKTGQNGSMVFKLPGQQDRDDVIAYLKTLK